MNTTDSNHWITSKEILSRTGISRATLNNYIKNGILPAPVIRTPPETPSGRTRRIGYFPRGALKRIETVHVLKREGKSMSEISKRFKETPISERNAEFQSLPGSSVRRDTAALCRTSENGISPQLTIEGVFMPAYLLDHDFRVVWINRYAEKDIFHQHVNLPDEDEHPNVFGILFDWRFHERVKNWRDLIALHIGFVKMKYSRDWLDKPYKGISRSEVFLLKEIYDRVTPFSEEPIRKTYFQFLTGDTMSEAYGIFTLFCLEGLFFLYTPLAHI